LCFVFIWFGLAVVFGVLVVFDLVVFDCLCWQVFCISC